MYEPATPSRVRAHTPWFPESPPHYSSRHLFSGRLPHIGRGASTLGTKGTVIGIGSEGGKMLGNPLPPPLGEGDGWILIGVHRG